MSRTARFVGALLLSVALVPVVDVGPAAAETSEESAASGAYYYSAGIDKPEAAPAAPPNVTGQGDYVSPEHLAVAVARPGEADKLSFLSFDLLEVPLEATVSKAVLSVPLAEDGNGDPRENRSVSPAPAKVQVCPAGDEGFSGEDGANLSSAPSVLCDLGKAPAKASADEKSYEFDVTALVQAFLTGENNGFALNPAVTSAPFQVVFQPAVESSLVVEYTAPAEEDLTTGADTVTDSGATAADTGTDAGTGDSGAVDVGGGFDAGTDPAGAGSVDTAPITAGGDQAALPEVPAEEAPPAPETAADPVAAGGTTQQVTPVASQGEAPLNPTAGFWIALVVLGGVLALLSLILGDPTPATASQQQASRLTRALQQQSAGGGSRSLLARPAAT